MTKRGGRWSEWERWQAGSDADIERTPRDMRMQLGLVFGQLVPKTLQQDGPLKCYDSMNRMVRDGMITIEISKAPPNLIRMRYITPRLNSFIHVNDI